MNFFPLIQNCLAASMDGKTVNRQSAGDVTMLVSSGLVMGRAVGKSRREKKELNVFFMSCWSECRTLTHRILVEVLHQ